MKFIVDANLSPRIAARLREHGPDAVAVHDVGLLHASDDEVLARAIADGRVIVSHDADFGAILAFQRLQGPSFILLRSSDPIVPDDQADMILANLGAIESELLAGAIAVFARGRLRIRRLPLTKLGDSPPACSPALNRSGCNRAAERAALSWTRRTPFAMIVARRATSGHSAQVDAAIQPNSVA